ncbi:formate dehydrogenase [Halioglobus maricola]|uniref:Formate dehydrogenase n=1 Tax=Halioglobus maricola TaxID=2601894 RepID=A0A5P9NJ89_9GAMM|nr:formate dehydrogenase subunit delta [Halioglobus maricola]QFU75625.1 formate dehydrogenase [Halioglobus maricola]
MAGQEIGHLVKMANQIVLNFGERRDSKMAAQRTVEHLQKFWTPAMREQLSAYAAEGGGDLSPALQRLLADS